RGARVRTAARPARAEAAGEGEVVDSGLGVGRSAGDGEAAGRTLANVNRCARDAGGRERAEGKPWGRGRGRVVLGDARRRGEVRERAARGWFLLGLAGLAACPCRCR